MKYFRLDIKYDGTRYHGWQIQPNAVTIQQELEQTIYRLTNRHVRVHGAGRTDAGVHALQQVAHFKVDTKLTANSLFKGLNGLLPNDIIVTTLAECDQTFHSRYNSEGKYYMYTIQNGGIRSLFMRNYSLYVHKKLSLPALQEASKSLIGTHYFKPFSANAGRANEVYERTIYDFKIEHRSPFILFHILGRSFLYKMVRLMIGSLIQIGKGKQSPDWIEKILSEPYILKGGPTAPAHGLILKKVYYIPTKKIQIRNKKCNFLPLLDVL